MISRVNPNVKFSYNIAKGTPQDRIAAMRSLSDKVYDAILPEIKDGKLKLSSLKQVLNDVMPEKKPIRFLSNKSLGDYEGASDYIYGKHYEVIGQTLEIPFKRGKIATKDLPVCMHEIIHVFDTLFNPKMIARTNIMHRHEQYDNAYDKCFDVLYHHEKYNTPKEKQDVLENVRKSVKVALSGRSKEDKINLIQELKNEMQSEYNAHMAEVDYAKKFKSQGLDINNESVSDYNLGYLFQEKVDVLKEIGFDLISNVRKSMAKKAG